VISEEIANREPRMIMLRILETVLATVSAQALREAPNECCGLLVGTGDLVDEAVPTRNVLSQPSRYQIDPGQHIDLNRRLRGTGRSVIGAYHSHPRNEAVPSPRDLVEAHYPEFAWLIVSLAGDRPEFRAYRIVAGNAAALEMRPVRKDEG
jgi:proteasome lid subunit RPN8/RPN11